MGPINPGAMLGLMEGDPGKYDFMKQTFADLKQPLQAMSDLLDAPANWSKFFAHGGKVIYHSAANDYITNARGHERLYETVVKRGGRSTVEKQARFYVTPQANHGSVGFSSTSNQPLPRFMDLLSYLEAWVEQGVGPPDAIAQTLMDSKPPYTVERSRPLCRYPTYPRYNGQGDAAKMESYKCAAP
jgi:hypothetical protein